MHPSPLQALANSLLVYNTGRSLGQFVDLMQRCGGRVAVPDVLVTAVGTKVRGRLAVPDVLVTAVGTKVRGRVGEVRVRGHRVCGLTKSGR